MECNKSVGSGKKEFTKEDKEIYKNLRYSYDAYMKNELLRFVMTNAGKNGLRSNIEWKFWAENILNSSLDHVTIKDAQFLAAHTKSLESAIKRKVFTGASHMKEFLIKAMLLPQDLWQFHGLGRVHERFTEADNIKAGRMADLKTRISILTNKLQSLAGTSVKDASKNIQLVNEKIEKANAKFRILAEAEVKDNSKIEVAREELQAAKQQLFNMSQNPDADPAGKALILISKALNGEISHEKFKTITGRLGGSAKYENIASAFAEATDILDYLRTIGIDASSKLNKIVYNDLSMFMSDVDAKKAASDITQFVEEDDYFPNMGLSSLYRRVQAVSKVRKLIGKSPSSTVVGKIRELIDSERTAHAKIRKGGRSLINYDPIEVIKIYAEEMFTHSHAASVGMIASDLVSNLENLNVIKAAIDNPNSPEVMYVASVKKLVMAQMSQIFDKQVSTTADEAIGTMTSFQVFAKLANISTSINNRIEGILMYLSHGGIANIRRRRALLEKHKSTIAEAEAEAHTAFGSSNMFDPSVRASSSKNLREVLSATDIEDYNLIRDDFLHGPISALRRHVMDIGGKALWAVGWETGENANRRESFNQGAAEAAEFAQSSWRNDFLKGQIPEGLIDNFELNRAEVEAAKKNKDLRPALFKKFLNKYIIRQGFRALAQTQFQYSESARNYMDLNSKTSWITMFQHYPRSLASTVFWSMYRVNSLYKTGGVRALSGQITSKNLGGLPQDRLNKFSINNDLSHVLTLGGMSLLRELIRSKTGLVLFNTLTHPAIDIIKDLYAYFVDDEPASKRNRSWELLYGRNQPIRNVTGPLVGTALDVASVPVKNFLGSIDSVALGLVEQGVHDGSVMDFVSSALGAGGFRTTDRALTDQNRKNLGSIVDILQYNALHSFSMYGKTQGLVNSIVSRDPKEMFFQSGRMLGVKYDWSVLKNDGKNYTGNKEFKQ